MTDDELFPDSAIDPAQAEPSAADQTGELAQPAAEPGAQPAPSPGVGAEPTVPLSVLLRTREELGGKLRQTAAEAEEAKRWRQEQERKAAEAAAQRPDFFKDPDAYQDWLDKRYTGAVQQVEQRWAERVTEVTVATSERYWKKELGADQWSELNEFIKAQSPQWQHQVRYGTDDPYGYAFEQFDALRQQDTARSVQERLAGKSLDEFVAEAVAAELAKHNAQPARAPNGQFQPRPSQPAQPRPSAPSLAAVNGAAQAPNAMPNPEDDFDSMFKR